MNSSSSECVQRTQDNILYFPHTSRDNLANLVEPVELIFVLIKKKVNGSKK